MRVLKLWSWRGSNPRANKGSKGFLHAYFVLEVFVHWLGTNTPPQAYLRITVSRALHNTLLASSDLMTPLVPTQPNIGAERWLAPASNAWISRNHIQWLKRQARNYFRLLLLWSICFTGDTLIARHAYNRINLLSNPFSPKFLKNLFSRLQS